MGNEEEEEEGGNEESGEYDDKEYFPRHSGGDYEVDEDQSNRSQEDVYDTKSKKTIITLKSYLYIHLLNVFVSSDHSSPPSMCESNIRKLLGTIKSWVLYIVFFFQLNFLT